MNYLIGDVQGCCGALDRLLAKIGFSASRDRIYLLGDLVNRGPQSLETLRRLRGFGSSAVCLLGNHDLNLLAIAQGVRRPHAGDTIAEILAAPDRDDWLGWLRQQRMAVFEHGWLMLHAGVVPQWDLEATLSLAAALETALRESTPRDFLDAMFGNEPARWGDVGNEKERLRFTLNTLTRIRFVTADGRLEFTVKDGAEAAPEGFFPWFDAPGRRTAGVPIAFGHWSTLGLLDRPDVLGLDTGCAWGGRLTAARLDGASREIFQVGCGC